MVTALTAAKGMTTKYPVQHSKKAERNLVLPVVTPLQFRLNYVLCFWIFWKCTAVKCAQDIGFPGILHNLCY